MPETRAGDPAPDGDAPERQPGADPGALARRAPLRRSDPARSDPARSDPARSTRNRRLRAGRRTNRALGWLLAGAFVTGALVFAVGGGTTARLVVIAHGVVGLAALSLVPWKRVIVRRSRRSPVVGYVLSAVVLVTLLAGIWQTVLGFAHPVVPTGPAVVTSVQLHVGAALLIVPLLGWHVLVRRRRHRRSLDLARRDLLRSAGAAGVVAAGYAVTAGAAGLVGPPRTSTGSRRVDPDRVPATIWLFDAVPELDPVRHRVRLAGTEVTVERLGRDARRVTARLDCTSGWYAEVTWTGHPLSELLPADRLATASSIVVRSVTGYQRRFPVSEASQLWLAVAAQGRPLEAAAGAPVRLVAPGRRGFWWVKWVAAVELDDRSSWWQPPFPLS